MKIVSYKRSLEIINHYDELLKLPGMAKNEELVKLNELLTPKFLLNCGLRWPLSRYAQQRITWAKRITGEYIYHHRE